MYSQQSPMFIGAQFPYRQQPPQQQPQQQQPLQPHLIWLNPAPPPPSAWNLSPWPPPFFQPQQQHLLPVPQPQLLPLPQQQYLPQFHFVQPVPQHYQPAPRPLPLPSAAASAPTPPQQLPPSKRVRTLPAVVPKLTPKLQDDSESHESHSDDEDNEELFKKVRRNRRPRSLGATGAKDVEPNGETRLDIKFTSFGSLPANPDHVQKWGRKGVIPDGLAGRFTFYGEDWAFSVKYRDLILCADGVERHPIEFGIQHKHWEVSETETDKQCRDRHNKGYTICNHVFALALDQRAKDYQELMQRELQKEFPNTNQIQQCQTRVDKLVPKRVSEGPLLFGLRHKAVWDALHAM